MKPFFVGFDADTTACGLVVFHRGKILKVDDVGKERLESWCADLRRELGADAHIIARVEMPTKSTAYAVSKGQPSEAKFNTIYDSGRCHEVAELMAAICKRAHINFDVEIVLSDHRIRCDTSLKGVNDKVRLVLGLEAARRKKWGNGKTSKTYPSKWTKTQATVLFPDLKPFKTNKDNLDALGLLYDLVVR